MSGLLYLIPAALLLGAIGLLAFLWALRRNQFDDLEGAQHRILFDDEGDRPGPAARPADPERAEPEVASRHDSGAR